MVDQLRSFASEVTRVAREVGTEGKLGGQACEGCGRNMERSDRLRKPDGVVTYRQVRNIAEVTKAVATATLSKKITVE